MISFLIVAIIAISGYFSKYKSLKLYEKQIEELKGLLNDSKTQNQILEAKIDSEKLRYDEKIKTLEDAKQLLSDKFEALSLNALNKNSEQFLHLAKKSFEQLKESSTSDLDKRQQSIEHIVKPLKESLTKMDEELKRLEVSRKGDTSALKQQLESLVDVETKLKQETSNLVKALRLPDVRGRWGEVQLRRVVELAGMINYCDFEEQKAISAEQRPDMIINLPGNRQVIIDAKAPFTAFLDANQEEDEEKRFKLLQSHAKHLKHHISSLSKKAYWKSVTNAPEFVILFLPAETFFHAALQADPSLIELATKENIIIATPSSLIGLLKSIAYSWKEFRLSENYKEVAVIGHELYKRLYDLNKHISSLGKSLNTSVDHFNKTVGSYESRVLVSARKFKDLGAGSEEISIDPIHSITAITRETKISDDKKEDEIILEK